MKKSRSKIIIKTRKGGYTKIYANGKWQKKITDIDFHADCNRKGIPYINVNCQFEKYVCDKSGAPIVSNGNMVKERCIAKI